MRKPRLSLCLFAVVLSNFSSAQCAELTARASLFGAASRAGPDDVGNTGTSDQTLTSDQQSLRLMLDDAQDNDEWSIHLKTVRQHLNGVPAATRHSSELFRYRDLSGDWQDNSGGNSSTRIGYELDRAFYKHRVGKISMSLGRQSVDWGTGRFWQPMNVFGAFAPTDLDTDYKQGIDTAIVDWFPSAFSSLTAIYALAPRDTPSNIEDSAAIHYRRQVGERSEMSLLAGKVIGNSVVGASFESDWSGLGWRIEGVHYDMEQSHEQSVYWIAGVDYQFSDGTLLNLECYSNSRGASSEAAIANSTSDTMVVNGLQPQLGQRVLGASVNKDLTPLINAGYKLFASTLTNDTFNGTSISLLHQISFVYSVSNESDVLLSLLYATGKGLNSQGQVQSEFGHLPPSMTLRWRLYF